jgi:hypothetical protein
MGGKVISHKKWRKKYRKKLRKQKNKRNRRRTRRIKLSCLYCHEINNCEQCPGWCRYCTNRCQCQSFEFDPKWGCMRETYPTQFGGWEFS